MMYTDQSIFIQRKCITVSYRVLNEDKLQALDMPLLKAEIKHSSRSVRQATEEAAPRLWRGVYSNTDSVVASGVG